MPKVCITLLHVSDLTHLLHGNTTAWTVLFCRYISKQFAVTAQFEIWICQKKLVFKERK